MRFAVIGAGVAGLAVATELAERGADVVVYERNRELGGNASWLAGGMLAPFCEGESAPDSVVTQGAMAIDWWARHVPDVKRGGTLVVAPPRDSNEVDRFASRTRAWERVGEARIGELEPDLAGRFRKGLFFAQEGHVDPRAAMAALRDGLAAKDVPVHFRVDVAPSRKTAGVSVVDCSGWAARDALPELRGVRGEMLLIRAREVRLTRPVRLLHPRVPLYVVPRADGVFMVGATMIESADRGGVTARSAIELLSAAFALHPAFGEAEVLEMRADIRPAFPDNQPRIIERDGRIYVNGFYRHGFLLSPHFAKQATELAMGEREPGDLGQWLMDNRPRIGEIDLPSRQEDRPSPFTGWTEDEGKM
jgi:glycine oxidase